MERVTKPGNAGKSPGFPGQSQGPGGLTPCYSEANPTPQRSVPKYLDAPPQNQGEQAEGPAGAGMTGKVSLAGTPQTPSPQTQRWHGSHRKGLIFRGLLVLSSS